MKTSIAVDAEKTDVIFNFDHPGGSLLAGFKLYQNDQIIADVPHHSPRTIKISVTLPATTNLFHLTAYDSNGRESGPSNIAIICRVKKPIPAPVIKSTR